MISDVEKKYGKSFCCAPWNTVWTGSNGDVKFCCASVDVLGNIKTQTIEEIYNNPLSKKLRTQFLQGEKPAGCSTCWEREQGGTSVGHARDLSNRQGQDVIDDSVLHTLEDGTLTKQNLKFVDLIWSNKCNFACIHCVPWLSSTISNNYKDVFTIWLGHDERNTFEDYKDPEKFNNTSKLEFILKHSESLEEIHFNGGEPFLQTETFTLLEELIKLPHHKNIKIWFHTNGSVKTYKNVDVVDDYLKKWQGKCQIVMSHDHFGERGEYFRYGYKEDKWLENFHRFKHAGIETSIDTSLTIFNVLTLDKLFLWYKEQGILEYAYPSLNYVVSPDIWNFLNLGFDQELKSITEKSLINTGKLVVLPKMYKDWYMNIQNCQELLQNPYSYATFIKNFIPAIESLDKKRSTNFLKTYPELNLLYEKLHDKPI
jgi:MoaA/NifB/PqqE/SkfB family radical SAM enzyme